MTRAVRPRVRRSPFPSSAAPRTRTAWAVAAIPFFGAAAAAGAQGPALESLRAQEPPPIVAGAPATAGEYDLAVDVQRYDVELALGGVEIEGRVALTVRANGASRLPLDLSGLGVREVSVDGEPVRFAYAAGKLVVPLGSPDASDSARVVVSYGGTPDDGLIARDDVHGRSAVFADNWPNRARFWLPSVDHPSDKAAASFTVHAPAEWRVIANGALLGPPEPAPAGALGGAEGKRTWRWATDVDHPTYTLVVGAAEFVVESLGRSACGLAPESPDPDGCVDVSFWVYPEDAAFARRVFARAPAMVDFFAELVGPYPFEKLANVQSATRFGGMENASAIFYSEGAIAEGRLSEGTVSHEIAHQWFGDSATESDWRHLWLSEGFATYFGALFFEAADGVDDFRARMERNRLRAVASPVADRPIVEERAPESLFDLLNANNYQKGAWALHMLRGVLGDSTFFRAMRVYYAEHAYGNALTEDLQRVVEREAGRSLDWFFEQWIRGPGHPVLEWEWATSDDGRAIDLTVRQVQSEAWPAFRLPMEVEIRGPGGAVRRPIEVVSREQRFRLDVAAAPDAVVLDPDGWVLKGDP